MSKRKLKQGAQITSMDQFAACEWVIVYGKPYHRGWAQAWQFGFAKRYVDQGVAFEGVRLTNGEYYAGKTDDQLREMIDEEALCAYCPLPEDRRGVHATPTGYVGCEGSCCDEALECWKEEWVE